MLYFAHIFFADHILNTIWTVYFAVQWWLYTPHDGRRNANSPAQQALIDGYIGEHQSMSEAERIAAAERVWRSEKAQALAIIILGWLVKVRLMIELNLSFCPYFLFLDVKVLLRRSPIFLRASPPQRKLSLSPPLAHKYVRFELGRYASREGLVLPSPYP